MIRAALIAAALLVLLGASFSGSISGVETRASYSTVVLIGDTQKVMQGYREDGPTNARYLRYVAAIDWIIAHEASENIAFVAALGDMIQTGIGLPPNGTECDAENGAPWRADTATCQPLNEAGCIATPGCFHRPNSVPPCDSCEVVSFAAEEWDGFMLQWNRLLPGGDLEDGIPFLTIHGNHDNSGNQYATDPDREPQGFNQHFSAAVWDALDGEYGDRSYEHLAFYDEPTFLGDGHHWMVEIGDQPVQVVSAACCYGGAIAPGQEAWAVARMATYPDVPAIFLTHAVDLLDDSLTLVAGDVAPNLFMVAGGHWARQTAAVWTDSDASVPNAQEILRLEIDWTYPTGSGSDLSLSGQTIDDGIKIVRIWPSGEVEVFDWSPSLLSKHAKPSNAIHRREFEVLP